MRDWKRNEIALMFTLPTNGALMAYVLYINNMPVLTAAACIIHLSHILSVLSTRNARLQKKHYHDLYFGEK